MSLIFNTKICPICNSALRLSYIYKDNNRSESTYICGILSSSHYQVIHKPFGADQGIFQRIYLEPYLIVNKAGTKVSKIYKNNGSDIMSYVMEVPMIVPKSKEQFLKKIKLYVVFS